MAERQNVRPLAKHRNEMGLSHRNWASAVLLLLTTLSIAFLGGYAVYSFVTKFGE